MLISIFSDAARHQILAKKLIEDGHTVVLYKELSQLPEHINGNIVILPIPTLSPSGTLNIQGNIHNITPQSLIELTDKNALIISCNYFTDVRKCIDINKYEPFTSMNAIPSAEGAIFCAAANSDITIFKSKCLVIGYGRIGKIIADRMKAFGAEVTVTARNYKDIYAAKAQRYTVLSVSDLDKYIHSFDFIFQTVPSLILDRKLLDLSNAVTIELASKGVGTDLEYAKRTNKNVTYAPAIPEKYSPITAGEIFYDSVINIIKELNI